MSFIGTIGQLGAALWILNVWILRFNKETEYRGGDAKNLPQEFDVYGFPKGTVYLVGATKFLWLCCSSSAFGWTQSSDLQLLHLGP